MLRAIREIRPSWVVGENVAGILTMVQSGTEVEVGGGASLFGEDYRKRVLLRQQFTVETICRDLEREGYSVQPFVIPACAVGAPHRRDRVWFVAHRADTGVKNQRGREDGVHAAGVASHSDEHRSLSLAAGEGTERSRRGYLPQPEEWRDAPKRPDGLHGLPRDAANARRTGREELHHSQEPNETPATPRSDWEELPALRWTGFPTTQPVIRAGDDGIPYRLAGITFPKWRAESIKALGNAWVPQVAYEIFRAIQQVENEEATTQTTP